MRAALGILRSLVVYWRPGRQRGLRAMYAPFVQAGDVVFDVGAHVGDRTAAFAGLGARVVALEPQPALFSVLQRMVGGQSGVTLLAEAAGREQGEATLAVSRAHPTLSTLALGWTERIGRKNQSFEGVRWDETETVPVTTLDALIERYGTPRFCKIDVEGHEAEVLAGLTHPVEALSVEFVSGGLEVASSCVARLESLGRYAYNAIPGEERGFIWEEWAGPDDVLGWLNRGADAISSGDLYARRIMEKEPAR